ARFRAVLLSAHLFIEQGELECLNGLLPGFHEEYQFAKLVLERQSLAAASNLDNLESVGLLQSRLTNIGMIMSHVQMRVGAVQQGRDCLIRLAADIHDLNRARVAALSDDRNVASNCTRVQFGKVAAFLQDGERMIPALT